ncbi:MAG: 3-phosphoshikimate 1-carboxyvinyltransferase [Alphaproteobacteria bacterium]|nr:3-phosphoshikimate 1-carboxyvinyltransferase [Alphaproteobacteria bacterium]
MKHLRVSSGRPFRGRIRVPGDKSISHRALIFNGLARGSARVEGLLDAADVRSTAACMRQLGVHIADGVVHGVGGRFAEPGDVLDCGNSGTSMRLLCGLLAAQPIFSVLTGDVYLRARPMGRVRDPLRAMGARIDGRSEGARPPLAIRGGGLTAGAWSNPIASGQVKAALLLATLGAEGRLEYDEPARSRDHTERMLRAMGVRIEERPREGGPPTLICEGGQVPEAQDVVVPGDISSAAFFLVGASITPGSDLIIEGVGVNPTRAGVLEALLAMGADIERLDERVVSGEPIADLRVRAASLHGARIEGELIPRLIDELPVLGVAAAFAEGETVIADAEELRVKESDRIQATVKGLRATGGDADERPDGFVVRGRALRGGAVGTHGDHRIGMAFAIAGCAAAQGCEVADTDNIDTSFPTFPELLERARA